MNESNELCESVYKTYFPQQGHPVKADVALDGYIKHINCGNNEKKPLKILLGHSGIANNERMVLNANETHIDKLADEIDSKKFNSTEELVISGYATINKLDSVKKLLRAIINSHTTKMKALYLEGFTPDAETCSLIADIIELNSYLEKIKFSARNMLGKDILRVANIIAFSTHLEEIFISEIYKYGQDKQNHQIGLSILNAPKITEHFSTPGRRLAADLNKCMEMLIKTIANHGKNFIAPDEKDIVRNKIKKFPCIKTLNEKYNYQNNQQTTAENNAKIEVGTSGTQNANPARRKLHSFEEYDKNKKVEDTPNFSSSSKDNSYIHLTLATLKLLPGLFNTGIQYLNSDFQYNKDNKPTNTKMTSESSKSVSLQPNTVLENLQNVGAFSSNTLVLAQLLKGPIGKLWKQLRKTEQPKIINEFEKLGELLYEDYVCKAEFPIKKLSNRQLVLLGNFAKLNKVDNLKSTLFHQLYRKDFNAIQFYAEKIREEVNTLSKERSIVQLFFVFYHKSPLWSAKHFSLSNEQRNYVAKLQDDLFSAKEMSGLPSSMKKMLIYWADEINRDNQNKVIEMHDDIYHPLFTKYNEDLMKKDVSLSLIENNKTHCL